MSFLPARTIEEVGKNLTAGVQSSEKCKRNEKPPKLPAQNVRIYHKLM